jgi:dTMP kinase
MPPGKLITIEGLDGAGKSTLAEALLERLHGRGLEIRLLREPGGVRAAEAIRELVKDPSLSVGARAEALLYAAARAQLVEEAVAPLLARGTWVLLDRFVDSSLAYQGGGRGLGIEAVREINTFGTGALTPDLTLLLVLDPGLGRARTGERGLPPDRLELEPDAFFSRIEQAYIELAQAEPDRIKPIDAAREPAAVLSQALRVIDELAEGGTMSA